MYRHQFILYLKFAHHLYIRYEYMSRWHLSREYYFASL